MLYLEHIEVPEVIVVLVDKRTCCRTTRDFENDTSRRLRCLRESRAHRIRGVFWFSLYRLIQ